MRVLVLCLILLLPNIVYAKELTASWYSIADLKRDGQYKKTKGVMANGQMFSDNRLTCASWDYSLGRWLIVTALDSKRSVIVRNTDRTARRFKGKRIDLSKGAFSKIADIKQGIVSVEVRELK